MANRRFGKPSLRSRIMLWYYTTWYGFYYGPITNIINALYFLRLAWITLSGKLIVVTSHISTSNGGYKYLSISISKRPLSAMNTYEDWGG